MPKINIKKALSALPAEVQAEIKRLEEEVKAQEATGQFNTVHHEAYRNFINALTETPQVIDKEINNAQ